MAAVLSCGTLAVLSHGSAAALLGIRANEEAIEVSIPPGRHPRRPGVVAHRRGRLPRGWVTRRHGIPVTTAVITLVDLARRLSRDDLEAAINQADSIGVATPNSLRSALKRIGRQPGAGVLRTLLDRRTFVLTASGLERLFLPLAREAGLSTPKTGVWLNGFKVDFYWPDLGLVVETDSLTYHRTPAQQNADRRRDQAHTAAGLTALRFTHAQVRFEPAHVIATLRAVAGRIGA
jgi:very-short-patch-repair endonuclease